MYCGPIPQTDYEPTLMERLEKYPDTLTDDDLQMLMKHPGGRGKNAQIPAKAYLLWERRHSPTEKGIVK